MQKEWEILGELMEKPDQIYFTLKERSHYNPKPLLIIYW
jgi:hypothetical protein